MPRMIPRFCRFVLLPLALISGLAACEMALPKLGKAAPTTAGGPIVGGPIVGGPITAGPITGSPITGGPIDAKPLPAAGAGAAPTPTPPVKPAPVKPTPAKPAAPSPTKAGAEKPPASGVGAPIPEGTIGTPPKIVPSPPEVTPEVTPEAAPEIPPPEASIPTSAEGIACVKRGGVWGKAGATGLMACVNTTRDGGKQCRRDRDCEGACLARSRTCAPITPLFGCHEILQDDGRQVTLCID